MEVLRTFDQECLNAADNARRTLITILQDNADTEYGIKYHFADISSVSEYKKQVPFSTFEDYEDFVSEMMQGKENLLTAYPVSFYAHTSGTLGAAKHIPYTEKAEEIVHRYASIDREAYEETLSGKLPHMPSEPKMLYLATAREDHAKDGTLITNFSGKFLLEYREVLKQIAIQPELIFCDVEMDLMYLFAFYVLREKNLICIRTPFMAAVSDFFCYVEKHWEDLCRDIEEGVLRPSARTSSILLKRLSTDLQPDPKRAMELRKIFHRGFDRPVVADVWPSIRKLKEHGCEVYFEKENIWTMDSKGELLITIMSSLAQEESRSISENTTWGIRQGFSEGKFSMPYGQFLGYRKGENGTPEIVPEEAEIVRGIYRSFLDGETPGSIARLLTARGVPSPAGKGKWHETTVRSMLQNEKYYGSALLQKHYTTDFLTHKVKKNEGELSQYYIENSHPAIITKEQWDLVQIELERRSRMKGRFSPKGPLASRLVCADCGAFFGAKTWHSSDPYKTVIWRCNDKYKPGIERQSGGGKCNTGHVTEEKVMSAFYKIVADLTAQRPQVLDACDEILRSLLDTSALDDKRKRAEHERDTITGQIQALVERQARETVEAFAEKYQELEKKYRRAEERLKAVDVERRDREYRLKQAELFVATIKKLPEGERIESTELFMALVDKVIVGDKLTFVLMDGTTRGVRF